MPVVAGVGVGGATGCRGPSWPTCRGAPPHRSLPDDPVNSRTPPGVEQLGENLVPEFFRKRLSSVAGIVAGTVPAPAPNVK